MARVDQRLVGAVLLFATVLVAAIVPRWSGSAVPGTPTAVVIQAPPTVGSCVLEALSAAAATAAPYGGCNGRHYGEVAQVFADYRSFPFTAPGRSSSPDVANCGAAVSRYLGTDRLASLEPGDAAFQLWIPAAIGTIGLLEPSALQQSVGQHWIACVTVGVGSLPFEGTVRGAYVGRSVPDSYAVCADSLDGPVTMDCAGPHRAELFARTGRVYGLPAPKALANSCALLARDLTGRRDVAAGGKLAVGVTTIYYGVTGHPRDGEKNAVQTEPAEAFCGISTVGPVRLTASLLGIGDGRLPLS